MWDVSTKYKKDRVQRMRIKWVWVRTPVEQEEMWVEETGFPSVKPKRHPGWGQLCQKRTEVDLGRWC